MVIRKIFVFSFVLVLLAGCSGEPILTREDPPAGTKVVVVEFSDFNCPACRAASETAAKIKNIPGLYFEFRHLPLPIAGHETSAAAANAFECARSQGFADEMEAALFENVGNLDEDLFLKIPEKYDFGENLDSEKFEACVTESEFKSLVDRDYNAARSRGINATPTFFVNGIKTNRSELLKTIAAEFEQKNADSPQ